MLHFVDGRGIMMLSSLIVIPCPCPYTPLFSVIVDIRHPCPCPPHCPLLSLLSSGGAAVGVVVVSGNGRGWLLGGCWCAGGCGCRNYGRGVGWRVRLLEKKEREELS